MNSVDVVDVNEASVLQQPNEMHNLNFVFFFVNDSHFVVSYDC